MNTIQSRIQHKRDTSSNWEQNNPIILAGEIIIVDTNSGERRTKTGDGIKRYNELPFDDEIIRNLVSSKDAETLQSAKQYTDEKIGDVDLANVVTAIGGGSIQPNESIGVGPFVITMDEDEDTNINNLFIINITSDTPEDLESFIIDKTFNEIKEAIINNQTIIAKIMDTTYLYLTQYLNNTGIMLHNILPGPDDTWTLFRIVIMQDDSHIITFKDYNPYYKVEEAITGNIPTFSSTGQLQDSGKGIDDLGKNDFVVTITGESTGPFTADKTFAEISEAVAAGNRVYATWVTSTSLATNINLRIFVSGSSGKAIFDGSLFGYNIGLIEFSISATNEVTGSIMPSHEHKPSEITDLAGTDYTTSRVRGIALSTSTPGTIPNGCLVGVYE